MSILYDNPNARIQEYTSTSPLVKDLVETSSISDRLLKIRVESRLTVREFTERIVQARYQVSIGTVNSYEQPDGTVRVPADYVAVVAREFRKNPTWLLTGEGTEEPLPPDAAERKLAAVRALLMEPADLLRIDPKDDNGGEANNA